VFSAKWVTAENYRRILCKSTGDGSGGKSLFQTRQVLADKKQTRGDALSHPVVIVLCIKLDAAGDRRATVVGRLLTTLGDDRR